MTHQGLIGSLGTSALLVSSAVAILLVVGTIVAFEGFPGPSADEAAETFLVSGGESSLRPAPDLVLDAPAGAAGSGGAPDAVVDAGGIAATATETAAVPFTAAPGPTQPSAPEDPPAPTSPTPSTTSGGDGGGQSPSLLGDTVEQTTNAIDATLERLRPLTGPLIRLTDRLTR